MSLIYSNLNKYLNIYTILNPLNEFLQCCCKFLLNDWSRNESWKGQGKWNSSQPREVRCCIYPSILLWSPLISNHPSFWCFSRHYHVLQHQYYPVICMLLYYSIVIPTTPNLWLYLELKRVLKRLLIPFCHSDFPLSTGVT